MLAMKDIAIHVDPIDNDKRRDRLMTEINGRDDDRLPATSLGAEFSPSIPSEGSRVSGCVANLHAFIDASPDAVAVKSSDLKYTIASAAFGDLVGLPSGEIAGKGDADLFPADILQRLTDSDRQVLETAQPTHEEIELDTSNGRRCFHVIKTLLIDDQQRVRGILVSGRDITALKTTTEDLDVERRELLSIIENLDEPIYISDPRSYELLFTNEAFTKAWGDAAGRKCFEVIQNRVSPCPFCTNDEIFGPNLGRTHNWEYLNPITQRWYRCIDRAIQWPDGRWVRSEIAFDLTDRKRKEEEETIRFVQARKQQEAIIEMAAQESLDAGRFQTAIRFITELAAECMEVERVSVWLLSQDHQQLRCSDLYERTTGLHSAGTVLEAEMYPRYFQALEKDRVIAAHNTRTDPRTREFCAGYLEPLGIFSLIDAAIRTSGKVVGALCCEHVSESRRWTVDNQLFAGAVADQVAQVLMNQERRLSEKELRESENRFKMILDCVQAGILLIDLKTHEIVEANASALELVKTTREKIIGRTCSDTVCRMKACQCQNPKRSTEVVNRETELVAFDGAMIPVLKTVVPIMLKGRRYILESFVDISDRKAAEDELKRHTLELAEAKARLEVLVSDTTSRERRMLELKQEVNRLLRELGREGKYRAPLQTEDFLSRKGN